jgi:hypothetical protein
VLQPVDICAKGVRLDHLGAGLQVLGMDTPHHLRLRKVQFVVAAVDEDAASIQHGAHRAVAKYWCAFKQLSHA